MLFSSRISIHISMEIAVLCYFSKETTNHNVLKTICVTCELVIWMFWSLFKV